MRSSLQESESCRMYSLLIIKMTFLLYSVQKPDITLCGSLHCLEEQGTAFGRVYSELPTLNDVFLEITGKQLRD